MKIKNIKTWKIKPEFVEKEGVPNLLLKAMNNNLVNFSNFNQAVGAICETCSVQHINTLFETYVTFGIFLAKNDMLDINIKLKKDEKPRPQTYLG